jgi:hypothetical protein
MKARILLLIFVSLLLVIGVLMLSVELLPGPPAGPTATFPKGIDFPDGRPVPRR